MYFGHLVRNGAQSRHGPERVAAEVHVQSGYDDTYTVVGKLVAYIDQTLVKELRFINAHYVYLGRE